MPPHPDPSADREPTPGASTPSLRQRLSPYLTKISHGSAPFISTFVLVHLTSPALATVGGSSLASQVMLLGREYYQTWFGEHYLLLLPLDIHVLAGMKRLLSVAPPKTSLTKTPRPIMSFLSLTGYSLFFFLRIHFHIHRAFPQDPSFPIYSLGPSELDYEFVKYGVQQWPWRSWFLYGGLTLITAWHAAEGLQIIYNTWVRGKSSDGSVERGREVKKSKFRTSRRARVAGATLLTTPALAGLWVISREPFMAFNSLASRFHAIFAKSSLYKF